MSQSINSNISTSSVSSHSSKTSGKSKRDKRAPKKQGEEAKTPPSAIPAVKPAAEGKEPTEAIRKVSAFPALRKHDNKFFPQVTYHIPVSMSYTQQVVDLVSTYHPCKLADLKVTFSDNEHPFCAAMRSIGEAYALDSLISELKGVDTRDTHIMDVGGSAKRHHSNGRKYVWSCVPKFDARDFIRTFKMPGNKHCSHRWEDCTCLEKDGHSGISASISVHSLYYIEPADILLKLLAQVHPVHYAVVHFYEGDEGTIMAGEMEYVKNGGQIWVKAKGNLTSYHHKDNDWMKTGHFSNENGTLEWDVARRFGDSLVLRFVASKEIYKAPPAPYVKVVEEPDEVKGMPIEDLAMFQNIVNESLNFGAEVNEKGHRLYLAKIQRKGHAANCNMEKLVQYASYRYMCQSQVLAEPSRRLLKIGEERAQRLALKFYEWDWKTIGIVISVVSACIYISTFKISDVSDFVSIFTINPAVIAICSMIMVSLSYPYWPRTRNLCKRQGLPQYSTNFLWTVKAMVTDYCCTMPDRPMDPTKCKKIRYPEDYKYECEEKPAAKAMVYHPNYAPFFPRKCAHNIVSCFKNKLLYVIPNAGKYTFPLHPMLVRIAESMNGSLEPLSFDEWVSRFPGPKEARLRREMKENELNPIVNWNDSSVFCKMEAYVEPKYPRPIVSAGVEFNFSIGRWLIPLAEMFAKSLPEHVMFPLHGDSIEIGRFHDAHNQHPMYDADFTAFDSSQREEVLRMIAEFLKLAGVPQKVIDRELQDVKAIRVKTRSGLKALISSIRCSGRSATLIGNSLVTINTNLHIFGTNLKGLLVKGDDSVIYLDKKLDDPQTVVKTYLNHGLVVKFREVDEYDVEFCSSVFLPCAEGTVLAPKFGKLLAKTFWCKLMHLSPGEIEQQFAGILKGLSKAISPAPGFNKILENPVYKKWFSKVEAHYDSHNEYASLEYTPDDRTLHFMCIRYGLEVSDLEELGKELSTGFPIRLSCPAAVAMIEKDWGKSNDGDHLKEVFVPNPWIVVMSPLLEEIVRIFFPWQATLVIGLIEAYVQKEPMNLVFHMIYMLISVYIHPVVALVFHYFVNRAGPKTNLIFTTMPKNKASKQGQAVVVYQKRPVKKPKTRSRRSRQNQSPRETKEMIRMIADPCTGPLVPGLYGSSNGVIGKFKSTVNPGQLATQGYILWAPSFVGKNYGNGNPMNAFQFSPADANTGITNNAGSPLGSANAVSGEALSTGASAFVSGNVAEDFRVLSACLKANYIGTTSNCKGRIAYLDNIPAKLLIDNLPSVNQIIALANTVSRTSLDDMEVVFRPSEETQKFKDDSTGLFYASAGVASTFNEAAALDEPTLIGFAWIGVPSNELAFEFHHNIEWRPQVAQGYVEPPIIQTSSEPLVKQSLKWLDMYVPGWSKSATRMAAHAGSMAASEVIKYVLGGPSQRTVPSSGRNLRIMH